MNQNPPTTPPPKSSWHSIGRIGRWLLRFVGRSILVVCTLVLSLWFLIKVPAVQNYAVGQATSYLSKELGTRVDIGYVDIALFNRLLLEGVYVEDLEQDTLLFAEQLAVHIDVISILEQAIRVSEVSLRGVDFKMERAAYASSTNLQFLVDYFSSSSSTESSPPPDWLLSLSQLNLERVHFEFLDAAVGQDMNAYVHQAQVRLRASDLLGQDVVGERFFIDSAYFALVRYAGDSLQNTIEVVDSSTQVMEDAVAALHTTLVPGWHLAFDTVDIRRSRFVYRNKEKPIDTASTAIDFANLDLRDITLQAEHFLMERDTFSGFLKHLSTTEKSGFTLSHLEGHARVHPQRLLVDSLLLQTPRSEIKERLDFRYADYTAFNDFEYAVNMRGDLRSSLVNIADIRAFAPSLEKIPFFAENKYAGIFIDGDIRGPVNGLRGRDLTLKVGDKTTFTGSFFFDNLLDSDLFFMELRCEELKTTAADLRDLGIHKSRILDRVGDIEFEGNLTGFVYDLVAYGVARTSLGTIETDLNFGSRKGRYVYSGKIGTRDFQLGRLLDIPNLEEVSFKAEIEDGAGLDVSTLDLRANAEISKLVYNSYVYDTISLKNGRFLKQQFNGTLESTDRHLDFKVSGRVDFNESEPLFDIYGTIRNVELKQLLLSEIDWRFRSGFDIVLRGNNIENIRGFASLKGLDIFKEDEKVRISSVELLAREMKNGRRIILKSDYFKMIITGNYSLINLPSVFAADFARSFPKFAKSIKLTEIGSSVEEQIEDNQLIESELKTDSTQAQDVRVEVKLRDATPLAMLIDSDFSKIENTYLNLQYNSLAHSMNIEGSVGEAIFGDWHIQGVDITGFREQKVFLLQSAVNKIERKDSLFLPFTSFNVNVTGDTLEAGLVTSQFTQYLRDINLLGSMYYTDSALVTSLRVADVNVEGRAWRVQGENFVRFYENYVEVENVQLTTQDSVWRKGSRQGKVLPTIELSSMGRRGLRLNIQGVDIPWVYDLGRIKELDLDGNMYAVASIEDIYEPSNMKLQFRVPHFYINGTDWGKIILNAQTPDLNSPIASTFALVGPKGTASLHGDLTPSYASRSKQNELDFDIELNELSASFAEAFMQGQITDFKGEISSALRLDGTLAHPEINGLLKARRLAATVAFLGTTYYLDEFQALLSPQKIDIRNQYLTDKEGQYASINGAIYHDYFSNWRIDELVLSSNRETRNGPSSLPEPTGQLLVMESDKSEGATFYGKVYANARVTFDGPFDRMRLTVDATTKGNSVFSIPLSDDNEVQEVSFINFVNKKDTTQQTARGDLNLSGIDIEMIVNVTPDATVRLIFDEQAGDIITGRGRGTLRILYTASEEFYMYGNYEITQGKYLFTYQNLVNKPFLVESGGTIAWNGDPYEAQIDLRAVYDDLSASPYNLIAGYLETADANTQKIASRATPVKLTMMLKGKLTAPDIDFDIECPNVDLSIRSYVEAALRTVRADKNELTRQVFGLIALRQFLPINDGSSDSQVELVSAGVNTLSELLSNQLSNYLSDLLSEVVADVEFINEIQVDVGLNMQERAFETGTNTETEVNFGLNQSLFNNRLIVKIGGNLDINSNEVGTVDGTNQNQLGGDFVVEYLLTPDGQLKVRAYNRTETTILGRTNRTGIGLSYRKEFNSFKDLGLWFNKKMKKESRQREK